MTTFNNRADLLDAVDTVFMLSTVLPNHVAEIVVDMKARFELVNPEKNLYWKETANGILSINSDSILFLREDDTKVVLFEQGLDEPVSEQHTEQCTWLYMYCLIWPLNHLNRDHFLMKWIEDNYKEI